MPQVMARGETAEKIEGQAARAFYVASADKACSDQKQPDCRRKYRLSSLKVGQGQAYEQADERKEKYSSSYFLAGLGDREAGNDLVSRFW